MVQVFGVMMIGSVIPCAASHRSSWGLCYTILLLTVVGAVFAAMVVYIKATHVLGYRATGRVEL